MDLASQNSFFRIVDAAANRACEGLRVAEDIVRMHLNDRNLSEQIKGLRHDLTMHVSAITNLAIASRDSVGDVGRIIETEQEYQRSPARGGESFIEPLLIANFKRAQQGIRTLEELGKTGAFDLPIASVKSIEQLRYRCYTVEKACRIAVRALSDFPCPVIYVLIDGCDWSEICKSDQLDEPSTQSECHLAKTVTALVDAEVDFIQLRDKKLSDRQLVAAGKLIAKLTRQSKSRFIMNDRVDLAIACDADGVHVGQEELTVADVRKIIGPAKIVGVSTHSIQQAKAAVIDGADYIGVGPVFSSETKSFSDFVGIELVRQVCSEISLPAFAIGGIDPSNADQVARVGCQRIAVTAAFSKTSLGQYSDIAERLRRSLAAGKDSPVDS